MKKTVWCFLVALAELATCTPSAPAAVVISTLNPANATSGTYAPIIGEAMLTGNQPISLSSVQFLQANGEASGETAAVYNRNADGSVGAPVFGAFTLSFDSSSTVTTATANSAFTLQANTGYYFVLNNNSTNNLEWSYTRSTDYTASFGATLPTTRTVFFQSGTTTIYYDLAQGPQAFQINGTVAAPEPGTWVMLGLGAVGIGAALRRRWKVV